MENKNINSEQISGYVAAELLEQANKDLCKTIETQKIQLNTYETELEKLSKYRDQSEENDFLKVRNDILNQTNTYLKQLLAESQQQTAIFDSQVLGLQAPVLFPEIQGLLAEPSKLTAADVEQLHGALNGLKVDRENLNLKQIRPVDANLFFSVCYGTQIHLTLLDPEKGLFIEKSLDQAAVSKIIECMAIYRRRAQIHDAERRLQDAIHKAPAEARQPSTVGGCPGGC